MCVIMMMIQVEILVWHIYFCLRESIILLLSLAFQSKDIIDPVILWKSIFYLGSVVGLIFFSCEVGQQITNLFEEIADRFDLLSWYLFPIKVQRLLPTVTINMNETIVVGCFGMLNGSRDQLKKVKNKFQKSCYYMHMWLR